jgi:hypothetical protein
LYGSIPFKLFCFSDFEWENEMSKQTKQRKASRFLRRQHAAILCILAMLAGFAVMSGCEMIASWNRN